MAITDHSLQVKSHICRPINMKMRKINWRTCVDIGHLENVPNRGLPSFGKYLARFCPFLLFSVFLAFARFENNHHGGRGTEFNL